MNYQCPLCFKSLQLINNNYRCEANHQFDRAKEGYVNLLPVQHKGSKDPGDSAQMMLSRRQFLDAGHYQLMRDKVAEKLAGYLPEQNQSVLDIGCGEGYYTDYFLQSLLTQFSQATVFGLDVSKVAIRFAAKRYKLVNFCVASSHRLPFPESSIGAIVRIYAPCKAEELSRVLIPFGILITVTPAAEHLQELKALIYDEVKLHPEKNEDLPNFNLLDECRLNYKMNLSGGEAYELLAMTPFAWRASEEVKQTLKQSKDSLYTADFLIRVYQYQGE
ncbi:MAG TPA: 23S rRNA (guanine(745)-N(1))-methyltransferase [Providencia sp.]|uniref:23S rRNA (guanine(745)-N(1))-methyltransferase n=1 Tax=Providencia sp. TaxID=589 RepID=UPI000E97D6F4|nr:23S rRNA (guanine(745)-N(1))-methyltransferase [Providencia sp.]MBP6080493.1 23S rRNA (guanine(745)-N(1))-methyltransferase [Providencia sp.]HBO22905.1 23S rRNA (guanine(745)-N(1))-methyltransferase [Providencia sp.]